MAQKQVSYSGLFVNDEQYELAGGNVVVMVVELLLCSYCQLHAIAVVTLRSRPQFLQHTAMETTRVD